MRSHSIAASQRKYGPTLVPHTRRNTRATTRYVHDRCNDRIAHIGQRASSPLCEDYAATIASLVLEP
jgi:hypothetical protein